MKDIQTVTGALDPSLLGFTLMHEHLLISSWNNRITDPEWLPYEKALDFIAPVIADAKAAGVDSIVDCSPFNLGRDVLLLRDVSERTGINIIATTGVYMDESGMRLERRAMPDSLLERRLPGIARRSSLIP